MIELPELRLVFARYFTHAIGDMVILRSTAAAISLLAETQTSGARINVPAGDIVLDRKLQECHGGVQGFYIVRRQDDNGRHILCEYTETELIAYDRLAAMFRDAAQKQREREAAEAIAAAEAMAERRAWRAAAKPVEP